MSTHQLEKGHHKTLGFSANKRLTTEPIIDNYLLISVKILGQTPHNII